MSLLLDVLKGRQPKKITLKATYVANRVLPTIEQVYRLISATRYDSDGAIEYLPDFTFIEDELKAGRAALCFKFETPQDINGTSVIKDGKLGLVMKNETEFYIDSKLLKPEFSIDAQKQIDELIKTENDQEKLNKELLKIKPEKEAKVRIIQMKENGQVIIEFSDDLIFDVFDKRYIPTSRSVRDKFNTCYLTDTPVAAYKAIIAVKMRKLFSDKKTSHYTEL